MLTRRAALRLVLLATLTLTLTLAAPALCGATTTTLVGTCPAPAYEQPFIRWLDVGNYVLTPNGALEEGRSGWSLTGGATVASGNESFHVRDPGDSASLALPPGSSATTDAMCVGATYPTLRLFARNTGSLLSTLKVEVLYTDMLGGRRALTVGLLTAGSSWQPTLPLAFLANLASPPLLTDGTTDVSFRFTPQGSLGAWRIDDVYVDPFKSN